MSVMSVVEKGFSAVHIKAVNKESAVTLAPTLTFTALQHTRSAPRTASAPPVKPTISVQTKVIVQFSHPTVSKGRASSPMKMIEGAFPKQIATQVLPSVVG